MQEEQIEKNEEMVTVMEGKWEELEGRVSYHD